MDLTTDIFLIAGLGVVIYMFTQLVKTIIDVAMGKVEIEVDGQKKMVSKRKSDPKKYAWLNRIVLPTIPPVAGILLGAFVPFRPSFLIEFVTEYVTGFSATVAYATYGALVGQFSGDVYSKVKKFVEDFKAKK